MALRLTFMQLLSGATAINMLTLTTDLVHDSSLRSASGLKGNSMDEHKNDDSVSSASASGKCSAT